MMKYYKITSPYYALIKAKNKENAVNGYMEIVSDIEEDFEIKELDKEQAWNEFINMDVSDDEVSTIEELQEAFDEDVEGLLLIDGSLF